MFELEQSQIETKVIEYCTRQHYPVPASFQWNPIPFTGEWGISTSFFQMAANHARQLRASGSGNVNVNQLAEEIAAGVAAEIGAPPGFSRVEAVRGYLNLYFSTSDYARRIVDTVLNQGADFGRGALKDERVMVEYAQPNTHHSFHIGHARNAVLGEVLARLVQFAGFDTIRASYPGDIGLGIITILWAYLKFYKGKEPDGVHERGQWLLKIYVEASSLLEAKEGETPQQTRQRETYEAERRELYRRWDAGDPEVRQVWLETRQWSLEELQAILEMLDIHIDVWFYESEVNEPSKAIVDELIALGIADDERPTGGPVIVKIDEKLGLKKEKYRTNVILRSDGTTLYLTKDLALAKVKFENYHVDRSLYVVDTRQSLHFQQAFKILELWGYAQAPKCFHLGYGVVNLPEGTMSARRGRIVLFKDVADEAVRRVLAVIADKNPDMPEDKRQQVASQVGLGALVYALLSVDNNKDIIFDMDEALNFDGHTAPYIQNACVRAGSILRKAGELPVKSDFDYTLSGHEIQLIDLISRFPQTVQAAAAEYRPLVIANYAYELAAAFHSFYHQVPVLGSSTETSRESRLRLVAAARYALSNALNILAIRTPEAM